MSSACSARTRTVTRRARDHSDGGLGGGDGARRVRALPELRELPLPRPAEAPRVPERARRTLSRRHNGHDSISSHTGNSSIISPRRRRRAPRCRPGDGPGPNVRTPQATGRGPPFPTMPGVVPSAWPLVGRSAELSLARAALASGVDVVVSGPLGVGRTRLADEVLAEAESSGNRVVRLTVTRAAASIPFGAAAPSWSPSPRPSRAPERRRARRARRTARRRRATGSPPAPSPTLPRRGRCWPPTARSRPGRATTPSWWASTTPTCSTRPPPCCSGCWPTAGTPAWC